ncbi:MAG: TonB-dependent hemoglobin/transferrin/lactoferrin family receptor [Gemmataceae bacterium]|nr:TonB-dependent hemoglobin/transferrin/lactoferrin family receptor [Gemmataceae bacterium]
MPYCSGSAPALLAGVSVIALTVAGAASRAVAEDVALDPITIVATKPVQRASPVPARVSTTARQQRVVQPPPASAAPVSAPAAPAVSDPMPGSEALAGVSTVRQQQINQLMPTRPADLLYGMPGVYVQERPDDPGTAINIRGLQDFGRVNVVIDGARQNFQRSGHNANGIFYLEPQLLSSIDVIRGPVANIYGSGAIGGVASFRTKDVEDVLKAGERWGVLTNPMGSSNFGGVGSAFAAARLTPAAEVFAGGTYRAQESYKDGNGDIVPNTGYNVQTGMVKGTFRPAYGHQVKLGYIDYDSTYRTGQPFPPGTPPPLASIYDTGTRNEIATARWTYARPDDGLLDFDANVYSVKTATDQTKIAGTGDRASGFIGDRRNFTVDTTGFDVNNTTRFDFGPLQHALNVGGDSFHDVVSTTGFGTVFTPSGERTVSGSFIQLKTNFANAFETIAAARYDQYSLSGGGVGTQGNRVSPKVTVGLTTIPGFTPYFIYAEGYRAPAVTETLVAGIHPAPPQFTFLPNPGLKPEVGKNKEFGLNLRYDNVLRPGDAYRAKVNIYRNDLDNYIELKFLGPFQGAGGQRCRNFVVFFCEQYQNIPKAKIEGIEFETNYDAGDWFGGVAGSHIVGRDITNGLPLATIPPDQVTTTLGARFLDRRLTVSVRWQAVAAKDPNDIPPGPEAPAGAKQGPPWAYFPTEAFNLVHLYLGYQINPDALASFSVENLLNEQYSRYLDVYPNPQHGLNSTPLPFFSPGITIKGALTVRFTDQMLFGG